MHMKKRSIPTAAAVGALLLVAVFFACGLPQGALADDLPVTGGSGAGYDTLSAAIRAGETDIHVAFDAAGCDIPASVAVTVDGGRLGFDGCVNNGALSVAGGALTGASFYNNGSFVGSFNGLIYNTGSCTLSGGAGKVYGELPASLVNASALFKNGNFSDQIAVSNGYYDASASITGAVVGGYYYDVSASGAITLKAYTISYYYGDGKGTAMQLKTDTYPNYYAASTSALTIPAAPNQAGYSFRYWTYNGADVGKTFRIAAGTMQDIVLYSYWNPAAGKTDGGAGAAAAKGSGKTGVTGAAGALTDAMTTADDDADDTVSAVTAQSAQSGGMRVRNASLTTRHTFTGSDGDVLARASQRTEKRFPWQWLGIGLAGALLVSAVVLTVFRRMRERDAATLEKLNIVE